jgi:antirestriction protein ArdC
MSEQEIKPAEQSVEPTEPKKSHYREIANQFIEQIEKGTAPWQKPWDAGSDFYPRNPLTDNAYKGINALTLLAQGRNDSRWLTYNQAKALGAQVQKGEKGTPIQYWVYEEKVAKLDEKGQPLLNDKGKEIKETVHLDKPKVVWSYVFNAEQIDGLLPFKKKADREFNPVPQAEKLLKESGAVIEHKYGNESYYNVSKDQIALPEKSQFKSEIDYYQTALHELAHWTGHSTRLNRDMHSRYGNELYAREELRAEIASVMLGVKIGIGSTPKPQNASYAESWIDVLKRDPSEIFRAAADADRAVKFISNILEKSKDREAAKSPKQEQTAQVKETAIDKAPAQAKEKTVEKPAQILKQLLESEAVAIKGGDYSRLSNVQTALAYAANVKTPSERREIDKAVASFVKDLQSSKAKLSAKSPEFAVVSQSLKQIDKQFGQGLSR